MRTALFVSLTASLLYLSACSTDPTAPSATEVLPVTVSGRLIDVGEAVPSFSVSNGGNGTILVHVITRDYCAAIVDARISRVGRELTIVSRVGGNPAANCADLAQKRYVTDYYGSIRDVVQGSYQVRLFEAVGNGAPQYIGTHSTTVSYPTLNLQ